jgi:tetratricopeptide (TPR) repeat protein
VTIGTSINRGEESKKQVQKAVGLLTKNPDKFKNAAARDYVLARALSWFAMQPSVGESMRKADLGYASDGEAQVQLLGTADSLFTLVERAAPDCAEEVSGYRQQPWAKLVNAASPLVDAESFDSARVLLHRANEIYRDSPFSYYFLAIMADKQQNRAASDSALRLTLEKATPEAAKSDSIIGQVREYALYSLALNRFREADKAEGNAKQAAMKAAAAAFKTYLDEYPTGLNSTAARSGLTSALNQSGDTATIGQMHADMVDNPAKYSDLQLFEAGTDAFNAKNPQRAAKLFEASLAKNALYRPALYNLTNTYFALKQWDKMFEMAKRLVEVDPNSPDAYQLLAIAQEGVFKGDRPAMTDAQTDSVRKIFNRGEALKTRITFTEFSHDGAKHMLKGELENAADARDVTVSFQFLDAQGNVVATKEALVKLPAQTCKGGGTGRNAQARTCTPGKETFAVEVEQSGVAAFRYQPIA